MRDMRRRLMDTSDAAMASSPSLAKGASGDWREWACRWPCFGNRNREGAKMLRFKDLLRRIWNAISGLELKSNWFKRSTLGFNFVLAVVMFIISYASEGGDVDVDWKNSLRDAMLFLIPFSLLVSIFGNLMDPPDGEAPLLPIFRRPQDAIYEPGEDIRNLQLVVASVEMANLNQGRRFNDLALENQMLRCWANY